MEARVAKWTLGGLSTARYVSSSCMRVTYPPAIDIRHDQLNRRHVHQAAQGLLQHLDLGVLADRDRVPVGDTATTQPHPQLLPLTVGRRFEVNEPEEALTPLLNPNPSPVP